MEMSGGGVGLDGILKLGEKLEFAAVDEGVKEREKEGKQDEECS